MPEFGKCHVCSETQYYLDSGMYFCETCNTALDDVSQMMDQKLNELKDEVEEEIVISPAKTPGVNQKRKHAANKKYFFEYTSWEIYNYALKGWVDELIGLGVNPELKPAALQIWTKILSLSKIAFFSTERAEKPRLGIKSSKLDAQILYGVKDIRKELFGIVHGHLKWRGTKVKKTKINSGRTKKMKLTKDLLNTTQREQEEAVFTASQMNTTLDNIGLNEKRKEEKIIHLNPKAKKALDDAIKMETEVNKNLKDEDLPLNFTTLIAVLRVSLIVIDEDLLVSDLFRLSDENLLSLFNIEKVVPASILDMCDPALHRTSQNSPKPDSVRRCVVEILKILKITYRSNLDHFCSRYCKELQLPDSVAKWAQYLIKSHSLFETSSASKVERKDCPDILAMASIIFVLRLLFSLDDVTERKQSEAAAIINKKIRKSNIQEPLLFEWNKWQEYLTCRKAVIAMYHYPSFVKLHQDMKFNADLLLKCLQKQTLPPTSRKSDLDEFVITVLKQLDSNLEVKAGGELNFPDDILRPFTSSSECLRQLLTEHKDKIPATIVTRLQQDFTSTSLEYLMDDNYLETLSAKCGLEISVTCPMDESLSVEKISEIQRLDRFLTDNHGIPLPGSFFANFFIPGKSTERTSVPKSETTLNLPRKAFDSSQNQLHSCNVQHEVVSPSKKRVQKDLEVSQKNKRSNNSNKSKESLSITKMSSRYWVSHIKPWVKGVGGDSIEFDIILSQLFPSSFVWLLKECCIVLNCTPNDLYQHICFVENVILGKYSRQFQ